jgi:hypothetical protein
VSPTVVGVSGTGRDFRRRVPDRGRFSAVHGAEREDAAGTLWSFFLADSTPVPDPEENSMFEDQKVELLPARTTMYTSWSYNQNFNTAVAAAVNAGNVNVGGDQYNSAFAAAAAGSNIWEG